MDTSEVRDRNQAKPVAQSTLTAPGDSDQAMIERAGERFVFRHEAAERKFCETHVALQIIILHIGFHSNEVAQHPSHGIFPEDDDLLFEKFDPAGI